MSGAEANYAKFSNSPLVRGDNSSFEPALFNKVGGVRGCTGATNNVAAANSNPGYNYKLVGGSTGNYVLDKNLPNLKLLKGGRRRGRRSQKKRRKSTRYRRSRHRRSKKGGNPLAVPSGYAKGVPSFGYEGADLATTSKLSPGHAPVKVSYNTSCSKGGARRRRRRTYKKRRHSKKSLKKRMKSRRRKGKKCCKCKCKICPMPKCSKKKRSRRHRMKGGYSQFMSNVPYSASYSTGGHISPSDLALANPAPHQRFINCPGN